MARLKGGKLLLDCSEFNIAEDFSIDLSDEEIDTILTKGLILKINLNSFIFTIPFVTQVVNVSEPTILQCSFSDNDNTYDIIINLDDKVLQGVVA